MQVLNKHDLCKKTILRASYVPTEKTILELSQQQNEYFGKPLNLYIQQSKYFSKNHCNGSR